MIKDYTLKNKKNYVLSKDQNEIVEALLSKDYFFNCAQTGFGKTFTTITAAVHKIVNNPDKEYHFILLLPGSAVKAFTDTLRHILGIPYSIYTATSIKINPQARFHIFNYSTIAKDVIPTKRTLKKGEEVKPLDNLYFNTLKKLKLDHYNLFLIADEAHVMQDPNTVQYQFMQLAKEWFVGMWFLTATPILNDLEGFFHMVTLVDPTFSHGILYAFQNKYMVYDNEAGYWIKGKNRKPVFKKAPTLIGYKNLDILKERFSKISIIKAKHYDIDFHYRSTKLTEDSIKYYARAAKGIFSGTVTKKKTRRKEQKHAGARLHDLQRVVSNSHIDFKWLKDENSVTEKEYLLVQTIKEVIERDEAVLVYFSYTETLDRIKFILNSIKDKINIPMIYEISGSIDPKVRKRVEENIQPRSVTLITSAGTESVNLQKANNLIFYEIPFSLRQFIQACGRIARFNSEFDLFNVYVLEAEGTIDTYKKNRVVANSVPIKSILGGSNTLPTELAQISLEDIEVMKDELLWWKA